MCVSRNDTYGRNTITGELTDVPMASCLLFLRSCYNGWLVCITYDPLNCQHYQQESRSTSYTLKSPGFATASIWMCNNRSAYPFVPSAQAPKHRVFFSSSFLSLETRKQRPYRIISYLSGHNRSGFRRDFQPIIRLKTNNK